MTPRAGLLVALVAFALVATAAFVPSGKRHSVTSPVDDWFERHYAGTMPNQCDGDVTCYGGGTYAVPEAALSDLVDDLEQACRAHPHVAILIQLVNGPPGSDFTRLDLQSRGVVDELVSRGVPCKIQVETRADVVQLNGRPWQAGTITTDLGRRYNASAQGCAHGTISHHHRTDGSGGAADDPTVDRECGWPAVGLCSAGSRAGQWCRCYGTNGQLDGDGTCVDALDTDCPSSTCAVTEWDADWFLTADDATVAAALDDYTQIKTTGRVDAFCDGITRVNQSDCDGANDPSTEQLVPAGQRVRPYIYASHFSWDEGSSTHSDGFTGQSAAITVSSATSNTVTVTGSGWTTDEWAGGRAYIRFDGSSWEARTIVSNTADTITVSDAWTTTPSPGTTLGIDDVGHTPEIRVDISGVLVDLDDPDARAVMAAIPFALSYDMGVPDAQLVVSLSTKFGTWSIAPPDDATINAPCRASDDSYRAENRFAYPSINGGEGYCAVTGSHAGALGNPWQTVGQYETLWNDVASRILGQIATSYFPNATMASVSAPGRNVFGTTIGGSGYWDGLASSVQRDTRYAGSRYEVITPDGSFPFNEPECRDGADNDSDTFIDYPADSGCLNAADTTESTTQCADGSDNDGDGATDYPSDTGCLDAADTSELGTAQCDDGIDNDGTGGTDYPDDADCTSAADDSEAAPTTTVAAHFTATPIQGATCVAPCAVHFDAIGDGTSETTDTAYSREFHTLGFRWDFGDPGAGTWSTGSGIGASRNAAEGGVAGHLYETAGTYDVRLDVTNPAGDTDDFTVQVVVTAPDTQFSGTSTVCIGNSMPTAGAGGCPSGAAVVSNSDLDDALSDTTTGDGGGVNGGCNADGGKVRCLFKGGDTFTAGSSVTLSNAAGPGLIGSYGTGMAIFQGPSGHNTNINIATLGPGWTITNVRAYNNQTGNTTSPFVFPVTSTSTAGVGIIGIECLNLANYCSSTNGAPSTDAGSPFNVAVIDNVTESDSSLGDADPGAFFLRHNNIVLMGNSFGGPEPDYFVRTVHFNKAVFAHNTFVNAHVGENSFQLRSCDNGAAGSCGGTDTVQVARWAIIADNHFEQISSGGPTIKVCDNSTCAGTGGGGGGVNDVIVERNFESMMAGSPGTGALGLVGWHAGTNVTVRNNVRDLTGMDGTTPARIVNFYSTPADTQTGVEVYNNTLFTTASGTGDATMCAGSANLSGALCYGNLAYVPSLDQENVTDGGNWTAADNIYATTMPFIATPPAQGLSRMADFNINVGSQADAAGYDFSGTLSWNQLDAGGCGRSAPWDAGAWQIGATGCLATESPIGINSEKMLAGEEMIVFADAIDDHPQLRHTADPATSREESFFRSFRSSNLATLEAGITIPTNARGWPSVDLPYNPGGTPVAACMDLMAQSSGRPIAYPAGTYTLRFDGAGEVRLSGDGTVTCTGTDQSCAVSITPGEAGVKLCITESDTGNVGDPITEVDLLLPGYTTADTFYWPTVVRLRPFGFLRSLNAIRVNDYECSNLATGSAQSALATCVHTWATRTQPTGIQASRKGISWEKQFALANAAQVDFWGTLPHAADATYLTSWATLARDEVDGRVIAERSSEPWNEADFAQAWYFINTGAALFSLAGEAAQAAGYVRRAAEMADALDAVFTGADAARLRKVLGTFTGSSAFTTALIADLANPTYNPTGATFDAVAVAPYFGGGCGGGGSCNGTVCVGGNEAGQSCANTSTWLLDDAEAEILELEAYLDTQYALISAANMEMWAYEGGPLMEPMDSITINANDDARMTGIVEDFFALWFANGGSTTGAGFFMRDQSNGGVLRYPAQPLDDAPRYRGMINAIEAAP